MASADKGNTTGFNTSAVVLGGVAAVFFLWALVLFLQGGFLAAQAKEYEAKVYDSAGSGAGWTRKKVRSACPSRTRKCAS